jgi:hypothetical protein
VIVIKNVKTRIFKIPSSYWIITILIGGFLLRWGFWAHQGFKGDATSTFESMSRFIAQGDWQQYLHSQRPHQPVYAILLFPLHVFNLDLSVYTFWLHQCLALGTIYIVYRTAKMIYGRTCGFFSAAFVSFNPMIAFWFSWISGDIPFHFFLAVFGLAAAWVWEHSDRKTLSLFIVAGVLCSLTRPEGVFVFYSGICLVAYQMLSKKMSPGKRIGIIAGATCCLIGLCVSILIFNIQARQRILSNIHVAFPLFISSRITTNSPTEQQKVYDSMGVVTEAAKGRPGFVSPNYALAMDGLQFIKDHPLEYLKMYCLRLISIIVPSLFSPWWSLPHRLYDFALAFIMAFGALAATFLGGIERFRSFGLTLLGFTIAFSISLFQREMDHRVPISMFVLFSMVSPFGWMQLHRTLMTTYRYDQLGSRSGR